MGRGKRRGGFKSSKKRKQPVGPDGTPRDDRDNQRGAWGLQLANTSRLYREYYQAQAVCSQAEDFDVFMKTLADPLPITIRLHAQGKFRNVIRDRIKGELSEGFPVTTTEEERLTNSKVPDVINPPEPIAWFPEENGWRFGVSKPCLRKVKALAGLKEFLKEETENGEIIRQEEASMIPPFFLDVQRHHRVLDMCAAPGSKTSQLLEALHADDAKHDFQPPSGMVVANDANSQRAYMLVSRLKSLNSPNLVVTSHDGQRFPNINRLDDSAHVARSEHGFFDRVLADVPCSGDGTLRKAPDIWRDFDPVNGAVLHPLQVVIAQRGVDVLKVGGLMVYSTCSLNPYENEAVVAQLLQSNEGALELVDTAEMHPKLKRRPGLKTWKVAMGFTPKTDKPGQHEATNDDASKPETSQGAEAEAAQPADANATVTSDKELNVNSAKEASEARGTVIEGAPEGKVLQWFSSPAEVTAFEKANPHVKAGKLTPSIWPPSAEVADKLHLERCMRIMPQDNNTSGFFVCLLRKTGKTGAAAKRAKAAEARKSAKAAQAAAAAAEAKGNSTAAVVSQSEEAVLARDDDEQQSPGGDAAVVKEESESMHSSNAPKPFLEATDRAKDARNDDLLPLPELLWAQIKDNYGFPEPDAVPSAITRSQFFWRIGGGEVTSRQAQKKRRIEKTEKVVNSEYIPSNLYIVNQDIANNILLRNSTQKLHVVSAGLLAFKKNQRVHGVVDSYRLCQNAVNMMLAQVSTRQFNFTVEDFILVWHFNNFTSTDPLMRKVAEKYKGTPIKAFSTIFQDAVKGKTMGSVIVSLEPTAQKRFIELFGEPLALSFWLGSENAAPMVTTLELDSIMDKACRVGFIDAEQRDEAVDCDALRRQHLPQAYFDQARDAPLPLATDPSQP